MTPEARAAQLMTAHRYHPEQYPMLFGDLCEAIRAAENDVLERAAMTAAEVADGYVDGYDARAEVVEAIRALKHGQSA